MRTLNDNAFYHDETYPQNISARSIGYFINSIPEMSRMRYVIFVFGVVN